MYQSIQAGPGCYVLSVGNHQEIIASLTAFCKENGILAAIGRRFDSETGLNLYAF